MPGADITSVTVKFSNGRRLKDFDPIKSAEVTLTANVGENEDGTVVLAFVSHMAMARVAEMLSAPRPETQTIVADIAADLKVNPPVVANEDGTTSPAGEPPARRTRGPNKPKEETKPDAVQEPVQEPKPELTLTAEEVYDEWSAGAEDIVITDQEILSATSKRAGELGAREPIVKLIATFATRTEGAPFKVQEIPAAQRKDYLTKLAALTA